MALTCDAMVAALQGAGLRPGDNVVLHSSFRRIGPVEGGPETVIEALLHAIGPAGNLMLPTFNYSRPLPEPHYDPATMPCRTGIIPELGRQRPDAVRSLHPTHSVAVIGPDARALTDDHLKVRAFGLGSPLDLLARRGGKVLLIGVGQTSNSTLHLAEEHAGIPKGAVYDPMPTVKIRVNSEHIIEHQLDSSPSCSVAFEAAAYTLRRHGAIADFRLGAALSQVMAAQDVVAYIVDLLRAEPEALLCSDPHCKSCYGTRANLGKPRETYDR